MTSQSYPDVFPLALASSSPPPAYNTVHKGFLTPCYSLGWLLRRSEARKLFPDNPSRSPIPIVANRDIVKKWSKIEWKYPELKEKFERFHPVAIGNLWDSSHIIVLLCTNSGQKENKLVEENKEEVISLAMELIGFSEEMKAKMTKELKWHRMKCEHDPYII
ncbi:hypothetical protein BT96DRAFT_973523 [Gymnopus androsaceus JB14]|uniref:Uncharacterized protein n=1 Tax=Gymnopus androsaceus JB14 TaxID=1447944 RepID=A0A6A4I1T5_9AGAR|nr:hypothetical protein BT96DRAFT_973523 [Gymnopus androsaceus JB14]